MGPFGRADGTSHGPYDSAIKGGALRAEESRVSTVTEEASQKSSWRTVNLDLGNMSELNVVAINPAMITHVRLTGQHHAESRKIEVSLTSGGTVSANFDDAAKAEAVFRELVLAMHRTVQYH
jgi:hypothetical protein